MGEWDLILARAEQRIASARDDVRAERFDVGYESARAAAELAGKALLLAKTGAYPTKDHNVSGALHQQKLLPTSVSAKDLSKLLGDYTRGDYGFDRPANAREVRQALVIAVEMLDHARMRGPP